ncbi:calcium-binding protein [Sulfitobacter pacificus]|uniref:calcium-binding protein n=1 Tax=Sulfitobacter pacificus TaxID=1499314 RepID=UPI003108F8B4
MLAYVLLPMIGLGLLASFVGIEEDDNASVVTPPSGDPDPVEGTTSNDFMIGTGGNDLLSGMDGDDALHGSAGDDTLIGGAGNDLVIGSQGDDQLLGRTGDDTLWGRDGDDRMNGSFGNDVMRGDEGDDVLRGGKGDDVLLGGAGDDALIGNLGNDLIETGIGADTVYGGSGNDLITGYQLPVADGFAAGEDDLLPDELNGGSGDDTITGNDGDTVSGGLGADLIRTIGFDQEEGGGVIVTDFDPVEDMLLLAVSAGPELSLDPADDRISVAQDANGSDSNVFLDDQLVAVLRDTDAEVLAADLSWLANIEEDPAPAPVLGTAGDDTLAGSGAADDINGAAGDDEIRGFGADDTIRGGTGDDLLIAGAGNDALGGEVGDDTLWGMLGDDRMDGGNGNDVVNGDAGDDFINGGRGSDALRGGAGDDSLNGGNDNDVIFAGTGADLVHGDDGNDRITGFQELSTAVDHLGLDDGAPDTLYGGNGSDTITANDGDLVIGGMGADVIRALGVGQVDQAAVIVTDFDPSEDVLMLVGPDGADAEITDGENLLLRSALEGTSTEVVYRGEVMALLQGTPPGGLSLAQSWFGNVFALPAASAATSSTVAA